jgi:hypothetical protein
VATIAGFVVGFAGNHSAIGMLISSAIRSFEHPA